MAVRGTRQYVDVLAPGVGLARTSRQYIDILAPGDGALRTSRQYVDILRVYDDFSAEVYNITILDFLNLSSVVDLVFGTIIEEVEDIIYFYDGDVQLVATEYIITVTSDLGLLSPGVASPLLENEMVLVSTVIAGVGEVVESELGLEHQVVTLGIFSETVTHTLNLNSTCTFYPVSDQRFDRQYYPFIGGATTNITPPSTLLTGPMSGITAPFQFVYPATGEVTDSVTLRAPEFGNKDRLTFNRVNRETRGGSLVVFANPTWPKIQTLVLSFTGLKQLEVQDLFDFITDYLGQEIGLIDWESRYWVGVITNPNESATEDSDNNFSINLEFEGELDEDWSPQVIPVTPGTPRRRIKPTYTHTPDPLEPVVPPTPADESYSAEIDSAVVAGQPLYVKANSHVDLANATTLPNVIGFAFTAVGAGHAVSYVTEGKLTLTDWTAITGTATLTPGKYYLSNTTGQIATTVPTSGYITRVGQATSTITLDIEIEPAIKL